jgi:hypothetical protein
MDNGLKRSGLVGIPVNATAHDAEFTPSLNTLVRIVFKVLISGHSTSQDRHANTPNLESKKWNKMPSTFGRNFFVDSKDLFIVIKITSSKHQASRKYHNQFAAHAASDDIITTNFTPRGSGCFHRCTSNKNYPHIIANFITHGSI